MGLLACVYLPWWEVELAQGAGRRGWRHKSFEFRVSSFEKRGSARAGSKLETRNSKLVLTASLRNQEIVVCCCPRARAAGIKPGLSLAEARALTGERVRVVPFDQVRSHSCLRQLARWCTRFSPAVALDPTPTPQEWRLETVWSPSLPVPLDGLLLDITGAGHLFGGTPLLLYEIVARLRRVGFTARVAAAPTIGAAWALARYGRGQIVLAEGEGGGVRSQMEGTQKEEKLLPSLHVTFDFLRSYLNSLPVAALRIDPATRDLLAQVGIERVEQLLALPRESLAARFDPALRLRIDQALGRVPELLQPLRTEKEFAVTRVFEGPATQSEAIEQAARELVAQLCAELLQAERGARALELVAQRADAPPAVAHLRLGRATRKAAHLWSLLKTKLETIQPSAAQAALEAADTTLTFGIEALTLRAPWTAPLRHEQLDALGQADDAAELGELLDTLGNRLGPARVLHLAPAGSHVPERAATLVPAGEAEKSPNQKSKIENPNFPWGLFTRPAVLLEQPEPAEAIALQPDHPPAQWRWRGGTHTITRGEGPERICGEWWRGRTTLEEPATFCAAIFRDYYKLQLQTGQWLWVFRDYRGRWFVQGIW